MYNPLDADQTDIPEADVIADLATFFYTRGVLCPIERQETAWGNNTALMERVWREAVLYARIAKGQKAAECWTGYDGERPLFGDGTPPLEELLAAAREQRATVVHFPLTDGTIIRMYVFKELSGKVMDQRKFLGHTEVIAREYSVFLMNAESLLPLTTQTDGDSWTLAYQLACWAIDTKNPQFLSPLAHDWLITGSCHERDSKSPVEQVELHGKKSAFEGWLRHDGKGLLPSECRKDSGQDESWLARMEYADTLGNAWHHITGEGIGSENLALPHSVAELHVLIGGSLQAALTALLLVHPKRCILWYSDKTMAKAEAIVDELSGKTDIGMAMNFMDSHDMPRAYQQLADGIGNKQGVVINITGGNRLMGFAAQQCAIDKHLQVIYRDVDADAGIVTIMQSENGTVKSGDFPCENPKEWMERFNWDWLYKKNNNQDRNNIQQLSPAEELKQNLWRKPTEGRKTDGE